MSSPRLELRKSPLGRGFRGGQFVKYSLRFYGTCSRGTCSHGNEEQGKNPPLTPPKRGIIHATPKLA